MGFKFINISEDLMGFQEIRNPQGQNNFVDILHIFKYYHHQKCKARNNSKDTAHVRGKQTFPDRDVELYKLEQYLSP